MSKLCEISRRKKMNLLYILIYSSLLKGHLFDQCVNNTFDEGFMSKRDISSFSSDAVECPNRFSDRVTRTYGELCYFDNNFSGVYYDCQSECAKHQATLAEPTSNEVNEKICEIFGNKRHFVGLYLTERANGKNYYHYSSSHDDATETISSLFDKGQPSELGSWCSCVVSYGECKLHDTVCTFTFHSGCQIAASVCEKYTDPQALTVFKNGFCYSFYKEKKTWVEAQAACREYHGFLAEFEYNEQMRMILDHGFLGHTYWIGMYKISGEDVLRYPYTGITRTNKFTWQNNQPSNWEKSFVAVHKNGNLLAQNGKNTNSYICQSARINTCTGNAKLVLGACYEFHETQETVESCQAICKRNNGTMSEPKTRKDWDALKAALKFHYKSITSAQVGIITMDGKAYLYSDYQTGIHHNPIDCLSCYGHSLIGSLTNTSGILIYDLSDDSFVLKFDDKSSKAGCMCKSECNMQATRCYAGNFDRDKNVCRECQEGYFGSDCSVKCSGEVCDMKGEFMYKCKPGRYGYGCEGVCSSKCKNISTCSVVTGTCLGCKEGYWGLKCDKTCGVCSKCDDKGNCLGGCLPGTYGTACENKCPETCKNGNCNMTSGNCYECIPGYWGSECDQICEGVCDQSGKKIDECPQGFYGENCDKPCSPECLNEMCSKLHGTCDKCIEGYYGLYCEKQCTSCNNCDRYGDCNFDCILGYYGRFCNKACSSKCLNQNCDKDGYCRECPEGFFGTFCAYSCPTHVCDQQGNSLTKCVDGLHGALCDKVCSSTCTNATCSQLTGACDSCVEGYYGLTCEKRCSPCHSCLQNGVCIDGCPAGYFGIDCKDECNGNCLNGACDMASGQCLECPIGKYGADCSENCTSVEACNMKTGKTMSACPDGVYGIACNETCPSTCLEGKCSIILGDCYSCEQGKFGKKCDKSCDRCRIGCDVNGFCIKPENEVHEDNGTIIQNYTCGLGYFGLRCLDKCSNSCVSDNCDANGNCLECPKGLYGTDCSLECPTGQCDIKGNAPNETLPAECEDGLYGQNCSKMCPKNCLNNCSRTLGVCDQCTKGFYGRMCNTICPKCKKCDRYGDCLEDCPVGTYGKKCELKCTTNCSLGFCNIKTGACEYCSQGRYGTFCEKECGNCDAKCDDDGSCQGNCNFGFYGTKCDRFCPSQCFLGACSKDGQCTECNPGFYGASCSKKCIHEACDFEGNAVPKCPDTTYGESCASNCSITCLDRLCQQETGNCLKCIPGFRDYKCQLMCAKCSVCDTGGACVSDCSPGLYGPDCKLPCKGNCLNDYCDKDNGSCFECPVGLYGPGCDKHCFHKDMPCARETGDMVTECETGMYGSNCDKYCPKRCLGNKCSKEKGSCFACAMEFNLYGVNCELQCGNCKKGCDKNGKCNKLPEVYDENGNLDVRSQCKIGFYGTACENMCSKKCLRRDCTNQGQCKACPAGFYGLDCLSKCPTNNCDMKGVTLKDCPPGKYGQMCEEKCSLGCFGQKCFGNGICHSCIKGFYGFKCEESCSGCDECDNMGYCVSQCHYGLYGPKCQFKCNKECFAQNCHPVSGICLECPIGFYGDDCGKECKKGVNKCDISGKKAQVCSAGRYGDSCDMKCPMTCNGTSCSSLGSCDSCFTGYYGPLCDKECGQCGSCTRGGTCLSTTQFDPILFKTVVLPRCAVGLTGANCDQECSSECLASNCDDYGNCRECQNGRFGKKCESQCEGVCDINGNHIGGGCEVGKFGPNCEADCDKNCLDHECLVTTGTCLNCPSDKFGQFCEKKCFGTELCDRTGKPKTKCYPGYFGERCEKMCNSKCLHQNCDANGFCLECPKGYFGGDCGSKCNSTVCDIETGNEVKDCPAGFYGKDCTSQCSDNCENGQCSHIEGTCASCVAGYFGLSCELLCPNCADCDSKGKCLSDCFPGYSGKSCDKACPKNCFGSMCNSTGRCSECATGFYGFACTNRCPNGQLCDENGELVKVCSKKYYGVNCTQRCPIKCKGPCSKLVGLCEACKPGSYGRFCEFRCKKCDARCNRQDHCSSGTAEKQRSINVTGPVVAALLLIIITCAALGFLIRGVSKKYENDGMEEAANADKLMKTLAFASTAMTTAITTAVPTAQATNSPNMDNSIRTALEGEAEDDEDTEQEGETETLAERTN